MTVSAMHGQVGWTQATRNCNESEDVTLNIYN